MPKGAPVSLASTRLTMLLTASLNFSSSVKMGMLSLTTLSTRLSPTACKTSTVSSNSASTPSESQKCQTLIAAVLNASLRETDDSLHDIVSVSPLIAAMLTTLSDKCPTRPPVLPER